MRLRSYYFINPFSNFVNFQPVLEVRQLTGIKSLSERFDVWNDRSLNKPVTQSIMIFIMGGGGQFLGFFFRSHLKTGANLVSGEIYPDWVTVVSCRDHLNFCQPSPALSSVAPPGPRTSLSHRGQTWNTNNRVGQELRSWEYFYFNKKWRFFVDKGDEMESFE